MEHCGTSHIHHPAIRVAQKAAYNQASPLAEFTNLSNLTNRKVKGKPAYWQTTNAGEIVSHLGIRAVNNDLLVLWQTGADGDWRTVNVSNITGEKITSDVCAWQTKNGPYNVEHLAAMGVDGSLLVFWWSPQHDWQVVNVSAKTGKKVNSAACAWQTKNGPYNVEHLAAMGVDGSLLVFWWSPQHDWQAVNVSAKTGKKVNSAACAWQTKNGVYNVEHLAAKGVDGSLLVFLWSPQHDWQAVNVSAKTGKKVSGAATTWQTKSGQYNIEHLAARGTDGSLLVFWWSPLHDWQVVDVSFMTGQKIEGSPDNYQLKEGGKTIEFLSSINNSGQLILNWWRNDLDWQMINVSRIANANIRDLPVNWTINGKEYFAAVNASNDLLIFKLEGKERKMTDHLHRPVASLSRKRNSRSKIIAIIWDPHRDGVEYRASRSEIDELLFGNGYSVKNYFLENSNGYFTISKAAIAGRFDSDYPPSEYWPGGGNAGRDSGREAIIKAAESFDFKAYDRNDNDELPPEELGILFLIPSTRVGGLNRVVGEDYTTRETANGITVDGVRIKWIAEVSTHYNEDNNEGSMFLYRDNVGIIAHELSHLLLGHGDMYVDGHIQTAADKYSIMDFHWFASHIDPVAKLKFGWLRPEIIFRTGDYTLQNIEKSHKVFILMNPEKGADEYFILENRFSNTVFDEYIPYQGLAVWHVTEKASLIQNSVPPRNVTTAEWAAVSNGFFRKGIRLIKPIPVREGSDKNKLWDGAFPELSYPLRSTNNNSNQSALVWADGSPSGFTIRNFSPAGETMTFRVEVP